MTQIRIDLDYGTIELVDGEQTKIGRVTRPLPAQSIISGYIDEDKLARRNAGRVEALCPMGCGQTIIAGSDGHLVCTSVSCPDPTRLDQVVNNERNIEHIVYYGEESFTVQHPLRERENDMDKCPLHAWISEQGGPTEEIGTYIVHDRREHDPTSESFRSDASPWVFDPIEGKLT